MADPVRDYLLGANGDLAVVNGDYAFVSGQAACLQGVQIRILTYLGEIYLDTSLGVDYLNQILIKNPDPANVRTLVAAAIADTPDVIEVIGANLVIDSGRNGSIHYKIRTVYSDLPVDDSVVLP